MLHIEGNQNNILEGNIDIKRKLPRKRPTGAWLTARMTLATFVRAATRQPRVSFSKIGVRPGGVPRLALAALERYSDNAL